MTPDQLHEEGLALLRARRLDEALDRIGRAVDLAPGSGAFRNSFGIVLVEMGENEAAAAAFRAALALAPADVSAWSNLGNVLRLERAHARASAIDPASPGALGNLASLRQSAGRRAEAERLWRRSLALLPVFVESWSNLGASRQHMGDLGFARSAFARAVATAPDFAEARFNRGLLSLLTGDYAQGLADYESRWQGRGIVRREVPLPEWRGEDPKGKHLYLWAEQGHGDTLQFVRFLAPLAARGAHVTLAVPARMVSLLASVDGAARVQALDDPVPAADLAAPLMSVPLRLGLGDATPAPMPPYLAASPAPLARDGRPVIGLVWAGSAANESDAWRSLDLAALATALMRDDLRFVSLQFGARERDIEAAGLSDRIGTIALGDFKETAGIVAGLDLVITVDTMTAHLAGSLGKEAWVMLAHVPDWRWGVAGGTTPWYPSLRLFRQMRPGDWGSVVDAVGHALLSRFPPAG